jgi:two-component system, NarL family, nitrate/nitrite response regulator NarL
MAGVLTDGGMVPVRPDGGGPLPARIAGAPAADAAPINLLILSDIRFLREGLAEILTRDQAFRTISAAADVGEALRIIRAATPDIVLIDSALPDGIAAVGRVRRVAPQIRIVALAVVEAEAEVIAWAEAGASGYVPRSAALTDLVGFLRSIMRGEQVCSQRVAAGLLHRIANGPRVPAAAPRPGLILTAREEEVARLIGAGLSNKEIARRLNVCVATTKSHVHNVLGKLELRRRSQVSAWMQDRGSP